MLCRGCRGIRSAIAVAVALGCGLASVQAGPATAAPAVESFSMTPSGVQAGGHPDLVASIELSGAIGSEAPEAVSFYPPEGLLPFVRSFPLCSAAELAASQCSPNSQVGVGTFYADHEGEENELLGTAALYLVEPEEGEFGRIAARIPILDAMVSGPVDLNRVEYGPEVSAVIGLEGFSQSAPLRGLDLDLWGVPADSAHDGARFPKETTGCPGVSNTSCIGPTVSSLTPQPFLRSPSRCDPAPPSSFVRVRTQGNGFVSSQTLYPATTGCDQPSFEPSLAIGELPTVAGVSTDLDVTVTVSQTQNPMTPSPSDLEAFSVDFERALEFDDSAARAHPICSDVVYSEDERCGPASRIGTATIDSPLFPSPITGHIHLGEVNPGISGGTARLIPLTASGFGVDLELWLVFERLENGGYLLELPYAPQIALESVALHFDGGEGGILKSGWCGEHELSGEFVPWNQSLATRVSTLPSYELTEGAAGPCPYVPAQVAVALAPLRLPADGISTATATATVKDFYGLPLLGESISFASTDLGHRIGSVVDNHDGTYSTRIVASSQPGSSTITATDSTTTPAVQGSATLVQGAVANLVLTPPPRPPRADDCRRARQRVKRLKRRLKRARARRAKRRVRSKLKRARRARKRAC